MHTFLPFLRNLCADVSQLYSSIIKRAKRTHATYRLDAKQLAHAEMLENLEYQVGSEVTDDVECRLCILLEEQDLQTDIPWHARVENYAYPIARKPIA